MNRSDSSCLPKDHEPTQPDPVGLRPAVDSDFVGTAGVGTVAVGIVGVGIAAVGTAACTHNNSVIITF